MIKYHNLAKKMPQLFDLEASIDRLLLLSLHNLNKYADSESSSIFLLEPMNQQLTSFSSLDLTKDEISIPKSSGVCGWVVQNRKSAIVNNAYADSRFYKRVDDMTGFRTHKLICTPLIGEKGHCLGTLQSLNKRSGDFTTEDLDLLNLAARTMALVVNNKLYNESL